MQRLAYLCKVSHEGAIIGCHKLTSLSHILGHGKLSDCCDVALAHVEAMGSGNMAKEIYVLLCE